MLQKDIRNIYIYILDHNLSTNFSCTSEEKTVLEEVTLLQHLSLQEFEPIDSLKVKLDKPRPAEPDLINAMRSYFGQDLQQVTCSYSAFGLKHLLINRDDVVLVQSEGGDLVAKVCFHVECDEHLLTCVEIWEQCGQNMFKILDGPQMIPLELIKKTCPWKKLNEDAGKAFVVP